MSGVASLRLEVAPKFTQEKVAHRHSLGPARAFSLPTIDYGRDIRDDISTQVVPQVCTERIPVLMLGLLGLVGRESLINE
jgi:hypothetical protein